VNFALTRKLIVFGLVLPLAAIIGFSLATPDQPKTFLLMALVIGLLLTPILLKWYHPLLIFGWNAWINVYFLPGKPQLWMLLAAIGFGIVVLNSTIERTKTVIHVPALTIPILFFLAVVLVTAKLTGGVGVRALGGDQIGGGSIGGKGYFFILFAILGYFVLASQTIPIERTGMYLSGFFLSGITGLVSNLAYMLGPGFYFLFYLFPVGIAMDQAVSEWAAFSGIGIVRIGGLAIAGASFYFFMMLRYGIRGIFDLNKPWRLGFFVLIVISGLFGGYRSLLITYILHFGFQFYFEGLLRSRLSVVLLIVGIAAGAVSLPFLHKMPLSVQRCMAFIPGVPVDQVAKRDAENSTRWRVEMWVLLVPEIPKYLLLGKGYALNPSELYLASQAALRGLAKDYETALVSGGYHSGPLSLIIPFGIFGTIAFLWFLGAGLWVLYRNYRYGDPRLQLANTFLLAHFLMRVVLYFFIFGAVDTDLYKFTGVLGISVALNRGVARRPIAPAPADATLQPVPA
jgi:hypothetical protein